MAKATYDAYVFSYIFVDCLLAIYVLSGMSPPLQSMHKDSLVVYCCHPLYHLYFFTRCSLRTWHKHWISFCAWIPQAFFWKFRWYVISCLWAYLQRLKCILLKWMRRHFFTLSPPSKVYDIVPLVPPQKYLLCFLNFSCITINRLFWMGVIAGKQAVQSKILK